jgi:hypothetical protein
MPYAGSLSFSQGYIWKTLGLYLIIKTSPTMMNFDRLKRFSFAIICCLLLAAVPQEADAQEESKFSMNVTMNSDQFFGFYPFFSGGYSLTDKMDFTFYGILWSGGTGGGWGNWTEFGVGMSFQAGEAISITPQVGFLGGNLLSSAAAGTGIMGDGIVPNITIGLNDDQFEGEFYLGYYAPLREEGSTLAYTHYWLNAGYKRLFARFRNL